MASAARKGRLQKGDQLGIRQLLKHSFARQPGAALYGYCQSVKHGFASNAATTGCKPHPWPSIFIVHFNVDFQLPFLSASLNALASSSAFNFVANVLSSQDCWCLELSISKPVAMCFSRPCGLCCHFDNMERHLGRDAMKVVP